jgi:hypothetical protein
MDILIPKLEYWPFNLDMIYIHELQLREGKRAHEIFDKKMENSLKVLLLP